jgi:hypothetical protein
MRFLLQSKLTLLCSTCVFLFLRNWPTAYACLFGQAVFLRNVADMQPFSYFAAAGNLAYLRLQLPLGSRPIGLFVTCTTQRRSLVRSIFGPYVVANTTLARSLARLLAWTHVSEFLLLRRSVKRSVILQECARLCNGLVEESFPLGITLHVNETW